MADWRQLSERTGAVEPRTVPYEGAPPHLKKMLLDWISDAVARDDELLRKAVIARLSIPTNANTSYYNSILLAAGADDTVLFDVIDLLLNFDKGDKHELELLLNLGGSIYELVDRSLEKRVSAEQRAAVDAATAVGDDVSEELRAAWRSAFGQHPDPDQAWSSAITALENLLIPIVVGNQRKPNLGHVAGQLKNAPAQWSIGLEAHDGWEPATVLEGLLRLVWPDPYRHGGDPDARQATQHEAEQIVHVAVLIVNLCRGRRLVKSAGP